MEQILAKTNRLMVLTGPKLGAWIIREDLCYLAIGIVVAAAETERRNMACQITSSDDFSGSERKSPRLAASFGFHLTPVGRPNAMASSSQSMFMASWPMSVNQSSLKYNGAAAPTCPGIDVGSMAASAGSFCDAPDTLNPWFAGDCGGDMTLVDVSPGRHCSRLTAGATFAARAGALLLAGRGCDDCCMYVAEKLCSRSSIWKSPEVVVLSCALLLCKKLYFFTRFMAVACSSRSTRAVAVD